MGWLTLDEIDTLFKGLTALGALIAASAAVFGAIQTWRNKGKLNSIHVDVNGRFTQMLELTAAKSHAEGVVEGIATEHARAAQERVPVKVIQAIAAAATISPEA